jgi:hypothetical protein
MEKLAFARGLCCRNETKKEISLETLEPEGIDSFQLEFFDTMLQQKKVTQAVFEDTAAQILKDNPKLKEALQQKR